MEEMTRGSLPNRLAGPAVGEQSPSCLQLLSQGPGSDCRVPGPEFAVPTAVSERRRAMGDERTGYIQFLV
jgi:hypothetical protein